MVLRRRSLVSVFGLVVFAVVSGCAGHEFETNSSRPGKFRYYDCALLDKQGGELLKRERELTDLMQKARQSPGGELVIAAAYQNDYNSVRSDLHEIDLTGAERNCALKFRTASERAIR